MEGRGIDEPHGGALLRGLAEEEADLLEGLGEGVSARHGGRSLWGGNKGRRSRRLLEGSFW